MAKKKTKSNAANHHGLHAQWSSERVFVLGAAGAAIGLNNIWQFPHYVGEYGGSAFLLLYMACLAVIGLPLLMSQVLVGRLGLAAPIHTIKALVDSTGSSRGWLLLGWISTLTGFFVLSYLSVIGGWTAAYALRAAAGVFDGLTADGINSLFTVFVGDPEKQIFWHSLFMVMTMVVVARGVKAGLEPLIRLAAPAFFVGLALLFVYGSASEGFGAALDYLFTPDIGKISGKTVLIAMGHAFFSLGLGFGVMMIYGTYLPDQASIGKVATWVVGLDLLAGLLAGVGVYAILFSAGEAVTQGPVLVFQAIPLALDSLPLGGVVGTLFFVTLVLAAWLTAVGLIEPAVAWLVEDWGLTRFSAALACGLAAWALGTVIILSFNYWQFSFQFFGEKTLGFFDVLQVVTSNFLLPLVGILVALFSGWVIDRTLSREILGLRRGHAYNIWLWLVRTVIPLLLLILLLAIPELFL